VRALQRLPIILGLERRRGSARVAGSDASVLFIPISQSITSYVNDLSILVTLFMLNTFGF